VAAPWRAVCWGQSSGCARCGATPQGVCLGGSRMRDRAGDMNRCRSAHRGVQRNRRIFVLFPPIFDPAPGSPRQADRLVPARCAAAAPSAKVVCLSTIGAQACDLPAHPAQHHEAVARRVCPCPSRSCAACTWKTERMSLAARDDGIHSFLQPLDKPGSMVATLTSGASAELITRDLSGRARCGTGRGAPALDPQ